MIQKFIRGFTREEVTGIIQVGNEFYLADKDLIDTNDKIELDVFSIGSYMGRINKKKFEPSLALLDLLSLISKRKLFVNDKSEWLFLCGRDLFGKGIVKSNVDRGLVLVQSEDDENLGYGKIIGDIFDKEKIVVNNLIDKGDYLRREKK